MPTKAEVVRNVAPDNALSLPPVLSVISKMAGPWLPSVDLSLGVLQIGSNFSSGKWSRLRL
jgi:hypothetical protein